MRLSRALERAGLAARYEPAEKLHVTLAFLGAVEGERVPLLVEALRAASAVSPFSLRFDRLGAFPKNGRAKIVWAGSRRPIAEFVRLADAIREAARAFATLDEKPPSLHVTLARLQAAMPLPRVAFKARSMNVSEIVLFESLPNGPTTRYEAVERFPLTVHASSPDASK